MKMGQWLRVLFEYFLFLEWKGGQFPAPSWGESKLTLTPFIEVPKPFSGLCRNVCAYSIHTITSIHSYTYVK